MSKQIDNDSLTKSQVLILFLGFSSLVLAGLTIISIKSNMGFLNIFHDNQMIFQVLSASLFVSTVYIDKKYNNLVRNS